MKEQPTLETERLILRPFSLKDAPEVKRMVGDRAVSSNLLVVPHPYEDGMAEEWIGTHRDQYVSGEAVSFAVLVKSTGSLPSMDHPQLIGAVGLEINREHRRGQLGYWLGKDYWNNGYATESVKAVIGFGFEVLGLNRICAGHYTRNQASGRVMQKAGMTYEGLRREHVFHWGIYEDLKEYAILLKDHSR